MLALTSVCERAPGEGQSGAGSRAGTRAREKGRGDRRGVLLLAERARGGGGWRAGHGAARLFGVSSGSSLHRRRPPSPAKQPSGPGGCRGAKSTSSRSFPHAAPRHRGALPTRARAYRGTLPPEPKGEKKNQNSKTKRCGEERARLAEVRRLPSPLAAAGARPPGSEAKSVSRSGGARCARAAPAGPASGARAAPAAWGTTLPPALPHTSGLPARGERERGRSADAGGEELGLGASDGRSEEEPRRCTAAEGGWSPQQSPRILR